MPNNVLKEMSQSSISCSVFLENILSPDVPLKAALALPPALYLLTSVAAGADFEDVMTSSVENELLPSGAA